MVLQFLCQFQQKGCQLGSRWQRTWTSSLTHKPRNLPTLVRTEPETWANTSLVPVYYPSFNTKYILRCWVFFLYYLFIYLFVNIFLPRISRKSVLNPKTITRVVWKFNKSAILGQEIWIFLRFLRCKFFCSKVDIRPTR